MNYLINPGEKKLLMIYVANNIPNEGFLNAPLYLHIYCVFFTYVEMYVQQCKQNSYPFFVTICLYMILKTEVHNLADMKGT